MAQRASRLIQLIRTEADDDIVAHEGFMLVEAATALAPQVAASNLARRSREMLGLCTACGLMSELAGPILAPDGLCEHCRGDAAKAADFTPEKGV